MTKEEKERMLDDPWTRSKYPHGKKAFQKALKEMAKMRLFDLEEVDGRLVIKN